MRSWNCVAIIGVGLIGGSVGLGLRRRKLAKRVVGVGRRAETMELAQKVGAVDFGTLDLEAGVAEADLIVVATPIDQIVPHVLAAAKVCPEGCLVTDAGSTKVKIVQQLEGNLPRGVRFVGSHPLAGSEKSGAGEANGDLFEGRAVVVTPTQNTKDEDFDCLVDFWEALGGKVFEMSPEGHDRAVATTSHVPHLLATALAAALPEEYYPLAGGGLLDTTRIAAGAPDLWRQILLSNRQNLLLALGPVEHALAALRSAIVNKDGDALEYLLSLGKQTRDALGS